MFDDENIMFYYEDSYECDNSNCTDTYIKYLGEERAQSFSFNPKVTFEILKWKPKVDLKIGLINMLV